MKIGIIFSVLIIGLIQCKPKPTIPKLKISFEAGRFELIENKEYYIHDVFIFPKGGFTPIYSMVLNANDTGSSFIDLKKSNLNNYTIEGTGIFSKLPMGIYRINVDAGVSEKLIGQGKYYHVTYSVLWDCSEREVIAEGTVID